MLAQAGTVLTERLTKQILAAYGIPVTREHMARDAEDAVAAAAAIGGPVALKIESPDIAPQDRGRCDPAWRVGRGCGASRLRRRDGRRGALPADARLDGVLIQEMVPSGLEMIVGVSRDPTFGPVVLVGFGGIHAELLADTATGIAPLDRDEVALMLASLRGARLLDGWRGAAPRDQAALTDLILRVSWLAHDLGDALAELDLNPVTLFDAGQGLRVVDALMVRRPAGDAQ